MQLNDYQEWTKTTAIYPSDLALTYLLLGLGSEVGEVQGKIKKFIRDDKLDVEAFLHEMGDCFYYLVRILDELNVPSEDVLDMNVEKLMKRKKEGTLRGSGDSR